ncbi:hypothetical protein GBAR_LOCUS23545, partial [Geodia barretti]
ATLCQAHSNHSSLPHLVCDSVTSCKLSSSLLKDSRAAGHEADEGEEA